MRISDWSAEVCSSGLCRTISRRYRAAASAVAERPPCFRAFLLPLGAPGLVPPCILHRRFPFTVGDWHSVPERVCAKQRGADASRAGCLGLIVSFSISLRSEEGCVGKKGVRLCKRRGGGNNE